jgi:hypothetical protein
MDDLDDLARDVRARGLARVFAARGRELISTPAGRRLITGENLHELIRADPELRGVADGPVSRGSRRLTHTRRTFVALAAAGLLEPAIARAQAGSAAHPHGTAAQAPSSPLEADGSPVASFEATEFQNWGQTVSNTPAVTFVPRTKQGVQAIVSWASAQNKTVRAAGYRHSWSDTFSADGQVLISMLPLDVVEDLPASEPAIDPQDQLQGIELVGTVVEDGVTKALCRIGAGTTNEQFRTWCLDAAGGASAWTVPLNVIMVEITWGGSNAQICHGAGLAHPTLSDLVTEVEFVNALGEQQTVSDPALLAAAAGCFGLLGIVTSLTLKLDPMTYATLQPEAVPLALAVPPPPGFSVPSAVDMSGVSQADLDQAAATFAAQCENDYYAEWFWFPYQPDVWVNCWNNDGAAQDAQPYPSDLGTAVEETEEYLIQLVTDTLFRLLPGRTQAELFGALAMANLPKGVTIVTPLIDALHYRRGIQNFRVLDMEFEIPIPPRADDPTQPDWSICQRAWWDTIASVYGAADAPMRVTLEMRIVGGSGITMAPEYGNSLGTCSIEVLTSLITPTAEWTSFMQDVTNRWTSYTDPAGQPLNVRPHWAKQWQQVTIGGQAAVDYLRDTAYAARIPEFRAGLQAIAAQGGYTVSDLQMFSNPLFDDLLGAIFE